MRLVRGDKLNAEQIQEVKRQFVLRWTADNGQRVSAWRGMDTPKMPLVSDEKWLADHAFYINENGRLSASKSYCEPHYLAEDSE